MRPVKCIYCSKQIDRNIEPFVVVSKRYAHEHCADEEDKERQDRERLNVILYELLGENVNFGMIGQQIKQFKSQYRYTISGITGTLYYCYKIKNMPITKKTNGIGIVPFFYKEAREYFSSVHRGRENAQGAVDIQKKTIHISSPRAEGINKIREISLEDL
jgi:hypothetical protein